MKFLVTHLRPQPSSEQDVTPLETAISAATVLMVFLREPPALSSLPSSMRCSIWFKKMITMVHGLLAQSTAFVQSNNWVIRTEVGLPHDFDTTCEPAGLSLTGILEIPAPHFS
mmetsp:Transcript_23328/g.65075  ORF Transcript_23328/g.65075 Transcript_23328/m.65075 type:complete len:113 (-) Transcript_23328:55-393(-)